MRVLLSGTSNSIIADGISTVLARSPDVTQFRNASYGASGTVAIGDHLRGIDFAAHDVCIIDYCVNEEVFLFQNLTALEDALSNMFNMVDAASRAGCLPVVLILPTQQRIDRARPLEAGLLERLRAFGVPFFNAYDHITALGTRYGIVPDDLFMDANHIQRWLNKFIGQQIIAFLKGLDFTALRLRETGQSYRPLAFLPHERMAITGDSRIVAQESRLMTREVVSLAPGAVMQLDLPAPCILSGVTLNAARSWGRLTQAESGAELFRTNVPSLFSAKRGLTLVSLPMPAPWQIGPGPARVRFEGLALAGPDRPEIRLELSGLILTLLDQDRPLAVLAPEGEGVCIDRQIDLAEEARLVQQARAERG
ncbi:MAG: hypothetical protein JNN06_12030 [Gemmobacter sp.]|uniref:hypothetical protein n=1 Tax=Gemmobacter sp. TaxID=1898957 RepID=UPI001A60BE17|nr:hypothetical protein [Gemmobacter sp.]MBL8562998.1 hypothetical protein [Gemmobacter sp.]